jgi:hypothetical protein
MIEKFVECDDCHRRVQVSEFGQRPLNWFALQVEEAGGTQVVDFCSAPCLLAWVHAMPQAKKPNLLTHLCRQAAALVGAS